MSAESDTCEVTTGSRWSWGFSMSVRCSVHGDLAVIGGATSAVRQSAERVRRDHLTANQTTPLALSDPGLVLEEPKP